MEEFEEGITKRRKIIRLILGSFLILLGAVFLVIPFIPLGYLFLIMGLFFLSPVIPWFRKLLEKADRKDKKGRVMKVRNKSNKLEERIDEKLEKLKRKR
jgi:uncharacterized membrane protein HdeD (DUF308 family)